MPHKVNYNFEAVLCMMLLTLSSCSHAAPKPMDVTPASVESQTISHPAVAIAEKMVGKPYRYGGASPDRGFDCSGLVFYAFRHAGIKVPRSSKNLYRDAFPVDPKSLRQGDLLFFNIEGKISHVGIYIGGSIFIHAPSGGKEVSYASLSNPYWKEHLVRAGRLF
jgi:cell wall-associated NlpC family hydrolase